MALYCSSGAALVFAWRDYMPTFTDASLAAAGTGALLWALLAVEAGRGAAPGSGWSDSWPSRPRCSPATPTSWCSAVPWWPCCPPVAAGRERAGRGLRWWLGSVAVFGTGVAVYDALVYGGPLRSGYRPGEVNFSRGAVRPNLRYMPVHLIEAMPMLVLGLVALAGSPRGGRG